MGWQGAWRVFQHNIGTDSPIRAVRVKADAFTEQLSTVFKSCDFVVEPLVRQLLFEQKNLFLCGSMAAFDVGTV